MNTRAAGYIPSDALDECEKWLANPRWDRFSSYSKSARIA